MSLLIFLAVAGAWLAFAWFVAKRIPAGLGIKRAPKLFSALLFPLLVVLPFADEIIGRWQFARLCEREAVVWLSPDWQTVKRAKSRKIPIEQLPGYVIQIEQQRNEYFDLDTGKTFVSSQAFHTKGGLLMRYGLDSTGGTTSCHPPNRNAVYREIRLEQLQKGN